MPWNAEAGARQPWGSRAPCPNTAPTRSGISRASRLLGRPLRQPEIDPSFPSPFLSLSKPFSGSSRRSQRAAAAGGGWGTTREPRKEILVPTGSPRYARGGPPVPGTDRQWGEGGHHVSVPHYGVSASPSPKSPDPRGCVRSRRRAPREPWEPLELRSSYTAREPRTASPFVPILRSVRPSLSLSVHPGLFVRPSQPSGLFVLHSPSGPASLTPLQRLPPSRVDLSPTSLPAGLTRLGSAQPGSAQPGSAQLRGGAGEGPGSPHPPEPAPSLSAPSLLGTGLQAGVAPRPHRPGQRPGDSTASLRCGPPGGGTRGWTRGGAGLPPRYSLVYSSQSLPGRGGPAMPPLQRDQHRTGVQQMGRPRRAPQRPRSPRRERQLRLRALRWPRARVPGCSRSPGPPALGGFGSQGFSQPGSSKLGMSLRCPNPRPAGVARPQAVFLPMVSGRDSLPVLRRRGQSWAPELGAPEPSGGRGDIRSRQARVTGARRSGGCPGSFSWH